MERDNNNGGVCASPVDEQAGPSAEIDLYDELTIFAELSPDEKQRLLERPKPSSTETGIRAIDAEQAEESLPSQEPESKPPSEPVTPIAIQVAEAEKSESPSGSASNLEHPLASVEPSEFHADVLVRPSGPLGSLTKGFVFTGALSRGVCLACGAESGTDDLFCITCGVFIDEISTTRPARSTCAECHQNISADEIFCPWCGASLSES